MYRFVMHVIPCPTFITEPQYYDCLQNGIYTALRSVCSVDTKPKVGLSHYCKKICGFWHENGSKPHISA